MAVSAISDAIGDIEKAVGGMFGAVEGRVDVLFTGLGQLSITLAILFWIVDGRPAAHGPFIRMIVKIMAIGWLIEVFPALSGKLITGFADFAGEIVGGGVQGFSLKDPGAVAQFGLTMAAPILKRAEELGGFPDFFLSLPTIFLYLLAYLGCLVAFFVIAIQLFITWLEWRFMSVVAFICIPFAILAQTSFIAERSIGYVASTGIKIFSLGVVIVVAKIAMGNVRPDAMSLSLALGAVCLSAGICVMALKVPGAAAGLVNGGPVMSATDAMVGLGLSAKMGLAAMKAAGGISGASMVGAGKVMQSWSGTNSASATPAMAAGGAMSAAAAGTAAAGGATGSARSYPGRVAGVGAGMVSAGQKLAQASGWHSGGGFAPGGAGAAGIGGTVGGSAAGGSAANSSWFQGPTQKQQYTAQRAGISLQGLNRAQASVALQNAGHGQNLAQGSAAGAAAIGGYSGASGGGVGTATAANGSSAGGSTTAGSSGGSGGGSGGPQSPWQVISQAQAQVMADEARYAAMAADPAQGNSMAQSLRAIAHQNTAYETARQIEPQDPAMAQHIRGQMALVDARVQSAQARGRPADLINEKSANDYRNIVASL